MGMDVFLSFLNSHIQTKETRRAVDMIGAAEESGIVDTLLKLRDVRLSISSALASEITLSMSK